MLLQSTAMCQCLLAVVCKVSNRMMLSGETFCFLEKRASSNLLFFYELVIGSQPTFLECTVIFL